jgi:Tol biopolymer transport system component/DNA-binding winged helix-turn-helix (wHTH) protein
MSGQPQPQPRPLSKVIFEPFEYDQASGELRKHGVRIRLQAQPQRILSILIERPGVVASRTELQRILWSDSSFGDFEQGLNAAVNKLRQALGDSADQPRYIETELGQGYRFVAPIQTAGLYPQPVREIAPGALPTVEAVPNAARSWMPWIAGIVTLGLVSASYWLGGWHSQTPRPLRPTRFAVTAPPGFAFEAAAVRESFALSPDGAWLAFTAMNSSGEFSVFIRDLNSLESRRIPDTAGAHDVFWAQDSQQLFATVNGKLRRVSLSGDASVAVDDALSFNFAGAGISPEQILLSNPTGSGFVSPSAGTLRALRDSYPWPEILPDRKHLLFTSSDSRAGEGWIKTAAFGDAANARNLVRSHSRALYAPSAINPGKGYMLWIRQGNLLAQPFDPNTQLRSGEAVPVVNKVFYSMIGAADISTSQNGSIAYFPYLGRTQLAWVDRQGHEIGTVGPPGVNLKSARLSPDGKKLAVPIYELERGAQNLWVFDTASGAGRQLTVDDGLRDAPVWSPDSRSLAFLYADTAWPVKIHVRALGEQEKEEAIEPGGFQMPTDWSSDGRFLAFMNTRLARSAVETQGDIWVVDLQRGRKLSPLINSRFHEALPAFSPDAKWIAFTSNESGQPELYVQEFRATDPPAVAGERLRVSHDGASAVRWRPDGKELFYLGFDGRIYAVATNMDSPKRFGKPEPLFSISTDARAAIHSLPGFDVSRDGKRFIVPVIRPSSAPPALVVVRDWEAGLAQKAMIAGSLL